MAQAPRVPSRINVSLSPEAIDAIDHAIYGLKVARVRVSTSALVEAAVLELIQHSKGDPRKIEATIRKHVGDDQLARRHY